MIESRLLKGLITLILLSSSFLATAQPGPGPGGPPPPNPVPITGIEILIGAGALLGAKRMIANRKTNT